MGPKAEEKVSDAQRQEKKLVAKPGMFVDKFDGQFFQRYKGIKVLGKGASGEVILCLDRITKRDVAVKIISKKRLKTSGEIEALLKEVQLLKQLDHPNIMKIYEYFEDKRYIYVVGEVYTGGELFDAIVAWRKFSEPDAAKIMSQVLSAVALMHSVHIAHRDLKPENIILESKDPDAVIKIIDFGLSTSFDGQKKLRDRLGTAYYIPPEVLKGRYDEKCDIWSAGVILYLLLCGVPPFNGPTESDIIKKVEAGKFNFDHPAWKNVSDDAKDLIRKMLKYHVPDRITAVEALSHPWFQTVLYSKQAKLDEDSLQNSLNNIRDFQKTKKLTQAALMYSATRLASKQDTDRLRKIFEQLDKNHDGRLDRQELIEGYIELERLKKGDISALDETAIATQVDESLAVADMDGSGGIEWTEFLSMQLNKSTLLSKQNVEFIFNKFDKDGSGKITGAEIAQIFGQTDLPHDVIETLVKEADKDNDGEVDFKEFFDLLTRHFE